jgi:hypothetical protein
MDEFLQFEEEDDFNSCLVSCCWLDEGDSGSKTDFYGPLNIKFVAFIPSAARKRLQEVMLDSL